MSLSHIVPCARVVLDVSTVCDRVVLWVSLSASDSLQQSIEAPPKKSGNNNTGCQKIYENLMCINKTKQVSLGSSRTRTIIQQLDAANRLV